MLQIRIRHLSHLVVIFYVMWTPIMEVREEPLIVRSLVMEIYEAEKVISFALMLNKCSWRYMVICFQKTPRPS